MAEKIIFIILLWGELFLFAASQCVAAERFVDNGDGTVTDNELGLMWAVSDNQSNVNWHQARKWAKYTFPDTLSKKYNNWRLPSLAELQSLVVKGSSYETTCGRKVHITTSIRLSCCWVWTAETDPLAPAARVFNFGLVIYYLERKAHRRGYRALAVRNLN